MLSRPIRFIQPRFNGAYTAVPSCYLRELLFHSSDPHIEEDALGSPPPREPSLAESEIAQWSSNILWNISIYYKTMHMSIEIYITGTAVYAHGLLCEE